MLEQLLYNVSKQEEKEGAEMVQEADEEWLEDMGDGPPDDDIHLPRDDEPDDDELRALLGDDDDPGGLDQMLQEERERGVPEWVFDDIKTALASLEVDLTVRL